MPSSPTVRGSVLTGIVLTAAGAVGLACGGNATGPGDDNGGGTPTVASVEVTPSSETFTAIGAQAMFDATARDSAGNVVSGASISWSSSDEAVATVDGTGTVTAEGNGEATITASAGGENGSATVTVDQEVSQLGLEPTSVSLVAGDTAQFSAEPADANGNAVANADLSWSSTDTTVVTVDGSGAAVARSEGEASVVAASQGVEDTASVSVRAEAASVTVTPDSAELTALGATQQYEATATDADGDTISGVSFTWSSSDTATATVDDSGLATAEASGTATITAELDDATGSATLVVDQQASSVTVSPDTGSVAVDDTTRFDAAAEDANGNALPAPDFAWSSTDTSVATVDSTGLVTGESDGSAMIVAETEGVADSSVVNVTRTVASVTVTPDSAGVTALDATTDYAAAAFDSDGDAISGVSFTWSSSDTTVATVDGSGVATARGNGDATITAATDGVSGSATFTVDQEVSAVTVTPDSASVTVDDTTRYDAEASDSNGNAVADADVAWSTTDTSVATVDSVGLVTGQSEGSAQVVAESSGEADSAQVVVEAQAAGSISRVSGDGQNGMTTRSFADPLVVEVTDGAGNPLSGVTVNWEVEGGAASLSSASTSTGSNGRTQVTVTSDTLLTTHRIEASVNSSQVTDSVGFELSTTVAYFEIGDLYFEDWNGDRNTQFEVSGITVGDTVMWKYLESGGTTHTVTSGAGSGGNSGDGVPSGGTSFDSGNMSPGATFRWVPGAAGEWTYYCKIHPNDMYGSVINVSESGLSGAASADLQPGDTMSPPGSPFVFVYRGPPSDER